jgi:hypothetical protein
MHAIRITSGRRMWFSLGLVCLTALNVLAHEPATEMAVAANHFLDALSPEQQAKARFAVTDTERTNWKFVPGARQGLPLKEMTATQRPLAQALLTTGLSQRGAMQAAAIMSLELILHDLENKSPRRDPDLYYFTIFGKPGSDVWGWRVEGHHLSVNFTLLQDHVISTTPFFFGSNPATVRDGPRQGLRVLGAEEDLGRALVKSLTATQQTTAILTNVAPKEIVTSNLRKINPLAPAGLPAAQMTTAQREQLTQLIKEYLGRVRPELAAADWEKIEKAGVDKISFAWAGGLEPGQGHYYRVQGPTFLLEYDNTQNHANHIHAVWREFNHDFGEDLLREHYEQSHHD